MALNIELEDLLKEIKAYRNEMVARNYPFQRISDIITKWEMKNVTTEVSKRGMRDFLEEAEKEKQELKDSYEESVRQTKERNTTSEQAQDELEPITSPMSDE